MGKKSKHNRLILVHNEKSFCCYVCDTAGVAFAGESFPGEEWHNPPVKVWEWARKNRAGEVIVLGEFPTGRLRFSLPENLDTYEAEKALGFEFAAISKDVAGNVRAAAMPDLFARNEQRLIACGLAEQELTALREACRKSGLKFAGAAPTGLIWLLAILHGGDGNLPQESFFYAGRKRSLLCVPDRNSNRHELRIAPVGTLQMQNDGWSARLERYLDLAPGTAVNLLAGEELPEGFAEFRAGREVNEYDRLQTLQDLAEYCARTDGGVLSGSLPLVSGERPGTGKFHYGHYAALILFAATLLGLGGQWLYYQQQAGVFRANVARRQTLNNAIGGLNAERSRLQQEKSRHQQLIELIAQNQRVENRMIPVLQAVCGSIPRGVRLSSVSKDDDGLRIRGTYVIQADLSTFGLRLQNTLSKYGFQVVPQSAKQLRKETVMIPGGEELVNKGEFVFLVK